MSEMFNPKINHNNLTKLKLLFFSFRGKTIWSKPPNSQYSQWRQTNTVLGATDYLKGGLRCNPNTWEVD